MIRFDILKSLVPVIRNELAVCNIGAPSQELCGLDDRGTNFHMPGTMGPASSIGFGLAVAQNNPVIPIDGDATVLTNLATLASIANNTQDNFILLVIDNGSYGSTGDQATYTGRMTSSAAVAHACGGENVMERSTVDTADQARAALGDGQMTVIVSKCDSGNVKVPVIHTHPATIRNRFMAAVRTGEWTCIMHPIWLLH